VRQFVPGLELARAFYEEAIAPLLREIRHSAALLGWGSDVLGFDTPRSTDHGWGPRLTLFVEQGDMAGVAAAVDEGLPNEFRGWPTRFGWDDVPVKHHVEVARLEAWLESRLGFDPRRGVSTQAWLVTPQQTLLEVTQGGVFHDGLGGLTAAREALAWYPDEVWLWLLACQWRRIDQEEPFVGRSAEVGDELGSRLIAARLVRDVIRLCFLQERRYAPYGKWLGSAFQRLGARALTADLSAVLEAAHHAARELALVRVLEQLAARHNELDLTRQVDEGARQFYTRPYRVLGCSRFVDACLEHVSDPWLRSLPPTGAIDQFIDSTDVLGEPATFGAASHLYDAWASHK
jgi:hypothetical protein